MKFTIFIGLLFYLSCDSHHETRKKTTIIAQPKTQAPPMEQKDTLKTGPELYAIPNDHPLPKKYYLKENESEPFTARNLEFAMAFFKHLSKSAKSNFIFSPIGLAKNMAMMHVGAGEKTKKEIEEAMHFDFSNEDAFYTYFGERKFNWAKRKAVMDNMNIFVPENTQLKLRAQKIINDFLHEAIQYTPFSDAKKAQASINSLGGLGEHPPLIEAMPDTPGMVFSSSLLYSGSYTNYRGFAHDRGFMKRLVPRMPYAKVDGVQAIELASDRKVLLILMPDDFKTFEEQTLNADFINKVKKHLKIREVNLNMDGFRVHTQGELSPLLQSLGIKRAFSKEADFSELSYEKLKVNALLHQSDFFYSTDLRAEIFKGKFNLNIDKPFFFLLREEEEGSLFFMGAIKDLKAAATPNVPKRR